MSLILKNLDYFWKNTKLIFQADPKNLLIVSFLKILEIPIPIAKIYLAKLIMDEISLAITSVNHDYTKALTYLFIELALVSSGSVLKFIEQWFSKKLLLNLEIFFSNKFFDKISKVKYFHLEDPKFADIISGASSNTFKGFGFFEEGVSIVRSVLQLVSFAGLLVFLNIYIAIGIIIVSSVSFWMDLFFVNKKEILRKENLLHSRNRAYFSQLMIGSSSAKELITIDGYKHVQDKYFNSINNYHFKNIKIKNYESFVKFILDILSSFLYYGFYSWLVIQTVVKNITLGNLTLYSAVFHQVGGAITSLYYSLKMFYQMTIDSKNYFEFLEIPEDSQAGIPIDKFDSILKNPMIEFENVSFQYPGSNKRVIDNLSFKIEYGQKIALVGENGAGKTTIIKLINRLYSPTHGVVKIGGIDISKLSRSQVSSLFSVVFQDFTQFKFIFKESVNIANSKATDKNYIDALEKSGADKILNSLPLGDNHPLTRYFSDVGVDLSGGQWQKIALARAFIRDSKILILDEPTAAIDANQEFEIFCKFQELTKGKTSLLVSHRFSTVRIADKILFLENGKIIEQGGHQELIFLNGKYAQMFNRQAQGYK